MKSLRQSLRLKRHEASSSPTEWNKYDERLLKAVESDDADKVTNALKKGANATKLDADDRCSLHLAARKGLINSLGVLLAHGVNLRKADAAGKTALHLSSRGGHSACVQRLLQCRSPVDSADLNGRTALHEAAYAGHTAIIKLLCSSGAAVNAVDKDGRSPLMISAQMGHARVCQQLLNCGASINLRDKQNKTALTLACEHVCHEVVEVLLKNKADVTAVDLLGHDPCYYARLSGDQNLLMVIKQAWDAASKAIEASKTGPKLQQQTSMNNESHALVRKTSVQVTQHGGPASFIAKEVPSGEADLLKRELWEMRWRYDAAQEELLRLDAALAMRTRDCEEMRRSSERALQHAHNHAWELEKALGEVQHRMAGSEARVRQMQAHLVAMRENLVEEMRGELHGAKEELRQSKREGEEQKQRNVILQEEVDKLTEELLKKDTVLGLGCEETRRTETACKEIQTPSEWKPDSSKTTMTDLTSETLQRAMDKESYISLDEHESVRNSLSTALQQAQSHVREALRTQQKTSEENQSLVRELQEQRTELDTLQEALQARFVPVALLETKETEVAQLKLALKQMEKCKEREAERKKASRAEPRNQSPIEQTSQNNRDAPSAGTPTDSSNTVNFKEENVLINTAECYNKDSEMTVEAEGGRWASQNSSSTPSSVCSLEHSDITILQAHINNLQEQLEKSERHYRHVLGIYRSRLLNAAQGYMDEEARLALLQIARMRPECVC